MRHFRRLSASLLCLALFLAAGAAQALPISDVLFSRDIGTGPRLESVGFDGTDFIGSATVLAELNPEWTAMSLVYRQAPVAVTEPGTLPLFALGLFLLRLGRKRQGGR